MIQKQYTSTSMMYNSLYNVICLYIHAYTDYVTIRYVMKNFVKIHIYREKAVEIVGICTFTI